MEPSLRPWESNWDQQIESMRKNFDHFFEHHTTMPHYEQAATFEPVCDYEETESHYWLTMDVPGMAKEDINIDVQANQIRVTGECREERRTSDKRELRYERRCGRMHRSWNLPIEVDPEHVEAEWEKGVLRIALPKVESRKKYKIRIQEGKGGLFKRLLRGKKHEHGERAA